MQTAAAAVTVAVATTQRLESPQQTTQQQQQQPRHRVAMSLAAVHHTAERQLTAALRWCAALAGRVAAAFMALVLAASVAARATVAAAPVTRRGSVSPPASPSRSRSGSQQSASALAVTVPPRLRAKSLVPPRRRKVLVLDLDETLIHSTTRRLTLDSDTRIEVLIDGQPCTFFVYKRPHVERFLAQVSKWFEVVIFTASMEDYASPVINWLDPTGLITRRYYRESCEQRDLNLFKNLTVIEPDLSQVFIVDNSPAVYSIVPDNAIPVESWYSDRADQALLDLLPFLDALRFVDDVRSVLSLRSS